MRSSKRLGHRDPGTVKTVQDRDSLLIPCSILRQEVVQALSQRVNMEISDVSESLLLRNLNGG